MRFLPLASLPLVLGSLFAQSMVRDISPGAPPSRCAWLTELNGVLLFSADDNTDGAELWTSDGTPANTKMLKNINTTANLPGTVGSKPSDLVRLGNEVFFAADDGQKGRELWKTDGTAVGTKLFKDIRAGAAGSSPTELAVVGNLIYFAADDGAKGSELWVSDGTEGGTKPVADINAGGSSSPRRFREVGNVVVFAADDGQTGIELWKTDGTALGTTLLRDIHTGNFGADSSDPRELTQCGGLVLFVADAQLDPRRLWRTDGTQAGTQLLDVGGAGGPFDVIGLSFMQGRVYFAGATVAEGMELWASNGFVAGTTLVKDVQPGALSSWPVAIGVAGNLIFFQADDGVVGSELWLSDGTGPGTKLVLDIKNGVGNGDPSGITGIGVPNIVAFAANDGANGIELWASDGRGPATHMVKDIVVGAGSSRPNGFFPIAASGLLFFLANDGTAGEELWVATFAQLGIGGVLKIGVGCPGFGGNTPDISSNGKPSIGNAGYSVGLAKARPMSPSVLLLNVRGTQLALGGGCTLYVDPVGAVSLSNFTSSIGTAVQPLPIPYQPAFVGFEMFLQWVVVDSAGAYGGLVSFSDALRGVLGY